LCAKFPVADNWYPKDLAKRAFVDAYLDWYVNNRILLKYRFDVKSNTS
jgi:hypothetical protein